MSIAVLSAQRSKDPNTQVGACIVNSEHKVVGLGYNGFPLGCLDDQLPWVREGKYLQTKYPYVVHAEQNAIINSHSRDLKGCTLYCTLFPCHECCKLIIQSGISTVIYLKENKSNGCEDSVEAANRLLDLAGVRHSKFQLKEGSAVDKLLDIWY